MSTIEEIYGELTAAYEAAGNVVLRDGGDMALRLRTVQLPPLTATSSALTLL